MKAGAAVAAFHALLGYAFIAGLAYRDVPEASDNLKIFDITVPPPLPEAPAPEQAAREPEGEASAANLKAPPAPIVAPPPRIRLEVPPLVVTAPSRGASDIEGPGSGSGGEGAGTGSGGQGSGTGGGGGTRAQRISGALDYEDLPLSARGRSARGAVAVRFVVQSDGRVTGCDVTRSSGDGILDETTCRLIERRFTYRPARDNEGQPVAQTVYTTFNWIPTLRR